MNPITSVAGFVATGISKATRYTIDTAKKRLMYSDMDSTLQFISDNDPDVIKKYVDDGIINLEMIGYIKPESNIEGVYKSDSHIGVVRNGKFSVIQCMTYLTTVKKKIYPELTIYKLKFILSLLQKTDIVKYKDPKFGYNALMMCNDQEVCTLLLNYGVPLESVDKAGNNILGVCAIYGYNEALNYFIKNTKLSVDDVNNKGETPLMIAIYSERYQLAKYILSNNIKQADVNIIDEDGYTALSIYIEGNHDDKSILLTLLEKSSKVILNLEHNGLTPLAQLLGFKKFEDVELMLKYDIDMKYQYSSSSDDEEYKFENILEDGDTYLHIAIRMDAPFYIIKNIAEKSDINQLNTIGTVPLRIATLDTKNKDVVKYLLSKGADVSFFKILKEENIASAVNSGIAELFIGKDVGVDDIRSDDESLICKTLASDDTFVNFEDIITKDFDYDNLTCNPLVVLIKHKRWEYVDRLLDMKKGIDIPDPRTGQTPLIESIEQENLKVTTKLLKLGALGLSNKAGVNPFMLACKKSKYNGLYDQLLELVNNVNVIDTNGMSALSYACIGKNISVIDKLLDAGADCNSDSYENSPLYISIVNNLDFVAKRLIDMDCAKDWVGKNGENVLGLLTTSKVCKHSLLRHALEKGVNINHKDLNGNTVLQLAVKSDTMNVKCICSLIEYGADYEQLKEGFGVTSSFTMYLPDPFKTKSAWLKELYYLTERCYNDCIKNELDVFTFEDVRASLIQREKSPKKMNSVIEEFYKKKAKKYVIHTSTDLN